MSRMPDIAPAPPPRRAKKAEGRQSSKKSDATRQRILDAAAAECAEQGYSLTKLSDIAQAAGIHISALYYHFDTKEALFTEVLAQVTSRASNALHGKLAELAETTNPRARLEAAIRVHLRYILPQDVYGRAHINIMLQAPASVRAVARDITRIESATFQKLFAAASKAGEIRKDVDLTLARMVLLGAMNWSVEWFRDGPSTVDDLADHVIKIIFDGMASRQTTPSRHSGQRRRQAP
jgi:AcrR family transcriptional regulator